MSKRLPSLRRQRRRVSIYACTCFKWYTTQTSKDLSQVIFLKSFICFSNPTSPPQSPIESGTCVPAYTLSMLLNIFFLFDGKRKEKIWKRWFLTANGMQSTCLLDEIHNICVTFYPFCLSICLFANLSCFSDRFLSFLSLSLSLFCYFDNFS